MIGFIILGVVIFILLILLVWVISTYNKFIRLRSNCDEGFSTMDVYLKKRFDLIPNLVETVKGYAKHESETLENVISARSKTASAASPQERMQDENMLSGALRQLMALSEAYPDLKANQNFTDLQNQLKEIESEIASSRKFYNAVVKTFNNLCMMIPSNIIANIFKFEPKPMFEVDEAAERQNVKVQF